MSRNVWECGMYYCFFGYLLDQALVCVSPSTLSHSRMSRRETLLRGLTSASSELVGLLVSLCVQ